MFFIILGHLLYNFRNLIFQKFLSPRQRYKWHSHTKFSKGFLWSQLWSSEPGRGCHMESLNVFLLLPSLAPCGHLRDKWLKNHVTRAGLRSQDLPTSNPTTTWGVQMVSSESGFKAHISGTSLQVRYNIIVFTWAKFWFVHSTWQRVGAQ